MLTHPILDQLTTLKLTGMHKALSEQLNMVVATCACEDMPRRCVT